MDTTVCACKVVAELEEMMLLYKARGGWNVSRDLTCGQVYYSHIDCQD